MLHVDKSQVVLLSESVDAAVQYIKDSDPRYFHNYAGDVFFISDDPDGWKARLAHPDPVMSSLLNEDMLGFHLLAEIAVNNVNTLEKILQWFTRSLASVQNDIDSKLILRVLAGLIKMHMVKEEAEGVYEVTPLGRVGVNLYFKPKDVFHWSIAGSVATETNLWESDLAVSWVVGAIPTIQLNYVPTELTDEVDQYVASLRAIASKLRPYPLVIPSDLFNYLGGSDASFNIRGLIGDRDRVVAALEWIGSIYNWGRSKTDWQLLSTRLQYGVPVHLVQLCRIAQVGGKRAANLYAAGIKTIEDVAAPRNYNSVKEVVGDKAVQRVVLSARELVSSK